MTIAPAVAILASQNQEFMQSLSARLSQAIIRAFVVTMTNASDEAFEAYLRLVVPLIGSSQVTVAQATATNIARQLAMVTGETVTAGAPIVERVTAETPWVRSPLIRLRTHLSTGLGFEEARELTSQYAAQLATGDLQTAARIGADATVDSAPSSVGRVAFSKVPSPSACGWCRRVSTQLYRRADGLPFHLDDKCGVKPVTREQAGGYSNAATIYGGA